MKKDTIVAFVIILLLIAGVVVYIKKMPASPMKVVVSSAPESPVGSVNSSKFGPYLTDAKGMTLYVFANDPDLKSTCTGDCLKMWPAFAYDNKKVDSESDMLSKRINVIKRDDGTYQYAYGNKPLYYYSGDKNPGETNGNGVNKSAWSIVLITK
jgi:predicted lipoprotein with Yx(FWY)xxD motif